MLKLLAFDYGASSGRAMLGSFDGRTVQLKELHRFSNDPVTVGGTFYWDVLRLFHEMKRGILKFVKDEGGDLAGVGIDTWGVDFGLLGPSGELLGNPVHYRDSRTEGMMEKAFETVSKKVIYEKTGIQFLKFNTLYQLLSMKLNNSPLLDKAETMLFMPDLLNYFLTGDKITEYTIASTSQMLDAATGEWAISLLDKLGIPHRLLTDIVTPGTVTGRIKKEICGELGAGSVPVVAVAGHDTGSAVISVPASEQKYAYLSSGTWSLLGIQSDNPIINSTTYDLNYTNEGGFNRTIRMLKNIMGLWIYQECKRAWDKTEEVLSFDELEALAQQSEPFKFFIDPDNDIFYSPGNMPEKIRSFCRETGQEIPEGKGETVRCIMESLAMKYRMAIEGLESIAGYSIPRLHIVGGGCKNIMLCQFTANAIARPVTAGPIEATAAGNLACQLIALGEVSGLSEARTLVRESFPTSEYAPVDVESWNDAYDRFARLCGKEFQL